MSGSGSRLPRSKNRPMPITFTIDPALGRVNVRMEGDVSAADLRNYMIAMFSDPRFTPGLNSLTVLQGMNARMTSSELMQYQSWRKLQPAMGKIAIVATTDAEYGVARMFELATDGVRRSDIRVFRKLEDAQAWLELPGA